MAFWCGCCYYMQPCNHATICFYYIFIHFVLFCFSFSCLPSHSVGKRAELTRRCDYITADDERTRIEEKKCEINGREPERDFQFVLFFLSTVLTYSCSAPNIGRLFHSVRGEWHAEMKSLPSTRYTHVPVISEIA